MSTSSPFPAFDAHLVAEMAAEDPGRSPHRILSVCTRTYLGNAVETLYFTTTSRACALDPRAHNALSNNGIVYGVNVVDCMYWKVCMFRLTDVNYMQHAKAFDPALLQPRVEPQAALLPWLAAWGSKAGSNAVRMAGLQMRGCY